MSQPTLEAHLRSSKGKGAAHKLRSMGRVPAICYGGNSSESIMLDLDAQDLSTFTRKHDWQNTILDLNIDNKGTKKVLFKEISSDCITGNIIHVDFFEISSDKKVELRVPVVLNNIPVGVTLGGMLQPIRRTLTIQCFPEDAISNIEIDVSEMNNGDSIHVSDVTVPDRIEILEAKHLTVATVIGPKGKSEQGEEKEEEKEGDG